MSVSLEDRAGIGVIWIDNPPVNAISHAVRTGLMDALAAAASFPAVVIACRGRTFMAGADIAEFGKPIAAPTLPEVVQRLDAMTQPIVAAIHGTALGGGFEVALACDYRVAVAGVRLGLPEVKIGLVPGAGGTQRLPRLVGVAAALDAITLGEPFSAEAALVAGVLDVIVDGEVADGALAFALELVRTGAPRRRLRDRSIDAQSFDAKIFDACRRQLAKTRRGFATPQRCVDAVEAAVRLPFDDGVKRESELSLETRQSSESRALRHLFFAERACAKVPGLASDVAARAIARVGVVGAGTMGTGIAMACLNAGLAVTLVEANASALRRAHERIRDTYAAAVDKGKLGREDAEARGRSLWSSLTYDALGQSDLIIEAVFEDMSVKQGVFRKLDAVAKAGALLATNTSYLNVDDIASATTRPPDVLGLHFFSPANVMKLLEIVRARRTSPDALVTALAFAKRIGKIGVVAGMCRGFIGNRMLQGYQREAGLAVLEGATPSHVDKALFDFGMAMGPFAVADLAGLDVGAMARRTLDPADYEPHAFRVTDRLVDAGRKGQKTAAGWYRYEAGDRTPRDDAAVTAIIADVRRELAVEPREISATEIVERCIFALVNEGARLLEERIATRASDIDVVYANGYGFPRYRGGPMHYAQALGLSHVRERIAAFSRAFGPRWWTPAPGLERAARDGAWPVVD